MSQAHPSDQSKIFRRSRNIFLASIFIVMQLVLAFSLTGYAGAQSENPTEVKNEGTITDEAAVTNRSETIFDEKDENSNVPNTEEATINRVSIYVRNRLIVLALLLFSFYVFFRSNHSNEP